MELALTIVWALAAAFWVLAFIAVARLWWALRQAGRRRDPNEEFRRYMERTGQWPTRKE